MSDSPPSSPAGPNVAVMKGIALGLGLLLVAGTALLITLVVTRAPAAPDMELPSVELQVGEKVTDVSLFETRALFVIENEAGEQRLLLVDLSTGARDNVPVIVP